LALGETHVIAENVAFFKEHGVDVTALDATSTSDKRREAGETAPKRSKTLIIVKNLPYDTTVEDLTKVFHAIGGDAPTQISLPPSKTAALVEFGHTSDARRAFRRLAYKKFKHVPLYLEWAPMSKPAEEGEQCNRSSEGANTTMKEQVRSQQTGEENRETISDKDSKMMGKDDLSMEAAGTNTGCAPQTIFIKNLNFSTSEEQLNEKFAKAGFCSRAVKIPSKAMPMMKRQTADASNKHETRQVSMGYGFVELSSEGEAMKAMKAMQGTIVDGHALEIKLSSKSLSSSKDATVAGNKASANTKIMVRNVPFEATRAEILRLFGAFGQLRRVRLPKKFDGTHRGFAFCEFVTGKEAQAAMAALARTHLYGRHLVLEWAAETEEEGGGGSTSTLREKAKRDARSAGFGASGGGKRRGKHLKF